VVSAGAIVAAVGVIIFCCFHWIAAIGEPMSDPHRWSHEVLWGAFGIAVVLAGTIISAVGLVAWCREDAG
jgi:hypothetical protein